MFNCESCGKTVPPRTRSSVVTVMTKEVLYPYRPKANRIKIDGKWEMVDDSGGRGVQTKIEKRVCPECYQRLSSINQPLNDSPVEVK